MTVEPTFAELTALGATRRGAELVEQTGATLGVAEADGPPLADLLDDGFLAEVEKARIAVEAARLDREIVGAEAVDLTRGQDDVLRRAKVWRRRAIARGRRVQRTNRSIPSVLTVVGEASGVRDVLTQLGSMTAAMKEHQAALGKGADRLTAEGAALTAELQAADDAQEAARIAELPLKVQEYYAAKGRLYLGLKTINDAGKELWADDPVAAGRYNLKILYRRD